MAVIKLKSEKRLKQVDTGSENANTYESGDIVYSTALDTIKKSDGTNWQDVGIVPVVKFKLTASGTDHYVFNGPGFANDNDPVVYLVRGQKYQFENLLGAHPFRISNSDGGSAYTDGITNNDVQNGILEWEVMHDVPNTMYYNCTAHAAMKGTFKILDAGGGSATNLSISNQSATTLRIESSTGNNADVPLADTSNAGLMSKAQFDKLAAIETAADVTDASNVASAGAIMASLVDAKGDILAASGDNTVARLAVGSNGKFLKADSTTSSGLVWGDGPAGSIPMFATKTLSGNTAVHTELNAGSGGTLVVSDASQNAGGTNAADGFMVNTASLTQTGSKARYEIISSLGSKGFRFKADTTAIDSFGGGQAQIAAGTGNSDGLSVSDSQKLVLLYTGSAWKYMVQSI